jgi:small-conductance mechanosensitive channel/CRP-like cAMP-binding protein
MRQEVLWALGLFAAIVVIAASVNRSNRLHRARIRRVVLMYLVCVVVQSTGIALQSAGEATWAPRFLFAAELLQAFTVVSVGATAGFSVLLPLAGINAPTLVGDLVVGIGYIASTLGVLSTHGLNPSDVVASATVVSAILAISLQSTLGNIVGGVALQLDGSLHEGDWVQLENGRQGRVRAVRWRHTVIETRDWSTIIVPNAQLLSSAITILGKRDGHTVPQRYWVWFNVDFRFPPTSVIQTVTDALLASPIEGVAADPPPGCVCMDFTKDNRESFATYAVRFWLTDLAADDPTSSRVRARIFSALRRAGIPLALPAQTTWVKVDGDERRAKRTAREVEQRFRVLRDLPLFRSLTDDEVRTLAAGLSPVLYAPGEVITRQGAVAHWLYILAAGEVEVRRTVAPEGGSPAPAALKVLGRKVAPDVFGEMGMMTGQPRTADVVATTDVDCFHLDKQTFERIILARPEIADELSDRLAKHHVELIASREGLDDQAKQARHSRERDELLGAIRSFFCL